MDWRGWNRAGKASLFCLLIGALASSAQAEECFALKSARGRYCVTRTEGSANPDLLYFMHGLNQDEHAWGRRMEEIPARWTERGVAAPTVVTISFGKTWILAEKNTSARSGLFETVVNEVFPEIEAALGGLRGRRLLAGMSMGGFNATQLFLKRGDLFARVAILCPAITSVSPFAPKAEIDAYVRRTKANFLNVYTAVALAKNYFATAADYAAAAPLTLAENLGPASPPAHISCGMQDDYGFQEGAEEFAQIAIARQVPEATWQALEGAHCTFDGATVADFLIPR